MKAYANVVYPVADETSWVQGCPPPNILVQVKGCPPPKWGGPLHHSSFPDPEPEYRGYPKANGRRFDPRRFGPLMNDDDIPQSNDSFETIRTDVPPLNEPNIPQSNEFFQTIPTDVPLSNEPMLTNVHLSIEPEPIIGHTEPLAEFQFEPQPQQVKDLVDFWFKSAAYTEISMTSVKSLTLVIYIEIGLNSRIT
ncbi:hypothetical protein GIB67_009591 [Kingdonia uniflora]|uniref:Uncharacterized protein n=1 Tax=Kingdonia uniflora TaxID=39325 RepID=A0A7J7M427_9MAGN|nr:hypothetical protein GIB67_009591 [Kingdonia uniflora]